MAGTLSENYFSRVKENANSILKQYGLDPWSKKQKEYQQSANDFGNYLNSGNYTTADTDKYRSSANKAVEDLTAEMSRYGKSSNEYKTLDNYRNFYQNSLNAFDRIDVGTKAIDYASDYDTWRSQEDYDLQKKSLQDSIDALDQEMEAMEDKNSEDYKYLQSYRDWYSSIADGLNTRATQDAEFQDVDDYTAFKNSTDFQHVADVRKTLKEKIAEIEQLDPKVQGMSEKQLNTYINSLESDYVGLQAYGGSPQEIQELGDKIAKLKELRDGDFHNLEAMKVELARLEKYGDEIIRSVNYGGYDASTDYQKKIDELREARALTEEGTKDREEIDAQIRAIAGVNGDGTNADGLFDESTWLGRQIMSDFDVEAAQKRLDEIDKELEDRGLAKNQFLGHLLGSGSVQHMDVDENGDTIFVEDQAAPESDPEVMALRNEKRRLTQQLNSSERLQKRNAIDTSYEDLDEEKRAQLAAKGLEMLTATDANGVPVYGKFSGTRIGNLRDLLDLEGMDEAYAQYGADVRDKVLAAIGAAELGEDIGYTVEEALHAYEAQINDVAGYKMATKRRGSWVRSVLGMGALAGLNQFAQGVKQTLTDDYVVPSKVTTAGAYTRGFLGEDYGAQDFLGTGSNLSQVLFDTTQTTANMLPMIAASTLLSAAGAPGAVPAIVGAGLMGVSSAGNSYNQALAEGWDKADARAFSIVMGAAEAGMQYLIGGIGALGGVTEEGILNAAKGINNAAIRWATETGVHILSETTEELAQNRLERYLSYDLFGKGDANWMKWDDDDWYTVIVTALSTGAMEGPGVALNIANETELGKLASGQKTLSDKQIKHLQSAKIMKAKADAKLLASGIGEYVKNSEALTETLKIVGTDIMPEDSDAHKLASKMSKNPSALALGTLFELVMNEDIEGKTKEDRQAAFDIRMAQVIGGAVQYNENKRLTDAKAAEEAQVEAVKENNPGARVLDANASKIKELGGVDYTDALQISPLVNKVLSGTQLSKAEMTELTSNTPAAKAARAVLSESNSTLTPDMDSAVAEAVIRSITTDMATQVKERQAQNRASVVQAAMNAAAKAQVNRATAKATIEGTMWTENMRTGSIVENATKGRPNVNYQQTRGVAQEKASLNDATALQEANAKVQTISQQIEAIKKMTPEELGKLAMATPKGVNEADWNSFNTLIAQHAEAKEKVDELSKIKFPSKEQRDALIAARNELTKLDQQLQPVVDRIKAATGEKSTKSSAKGKAAIPAKAKGEAAQSSTDTITLPSGQVLTRAEFEGTDEEFNELAAMAGQKGNVNEQQQSGASDEERNTVGERGDRTENGQREARAKADRSGEEPLAELRTQGDELAAKVSRDAKLTDSEDISKLEGEYEDIRELTDELKKAGFSRITYVTDGDLYTTGDEPVKANGAVRNGEIFLRLGKYNYRAEARHEIVHQKLQLLGQNEARGFVASAIQSIVPRDAYMDAYPKYAAVYGPVYLDHSKLSDDDIAALIREEMLCDMFAGINRFGAQLGLFDEDAAGFFSASNFDAITDNLAKGLTPGASLAVEEVENAEPYGIKASELKGVDVVQDLTNSSGEVVATTNDIGHGVFSLVTYDNGGREALNTFLKQQIRNKALTKDEAYDIASKMEELYNICQTFNDGTYAPFSEWSNATVVEVDGKPVFSVVKQNGEYKLNLDFSLVCKKRRALDAVFNEMISRGLMNKIVGNKSFLEMSPASIAQINNIIREHGFETACALCFVDSKRFRQAMVADAFVSMYNAQVNSLTEGTKKKATYFNYGGDRVLANQDSRRTGIEKLPDFALNWSKVNDILANGKKGTVEYKIAQHLKKNPSARKLTSRGDFMSTAGFDALNAQNPELLKRYNSKKGTGGPKAAQSDVQYLNEIIQRRAFNKKAAYEVGGVRIQSFSDYVGRLVFDYIQMVGDLSAKELPAHAYTKEFLFAQQFGMTGIKINMSLVPRVVEGGVAPGLDANGNYAWQDGQSFGSTVYDNNGKRMTADEGFQLAIQIQNADGYSANCGTIAVGVSDAHILKMLNDPNIRMVIPYHKSSLNHLVAAMNQIDQYTDYTDVQNTRDRNGKRLPASEEFDWNTKLQEMERQGLGAKEAAQAYLDWCAEKDHQYIPKFDQFAYHENYYKLLEDFTAYDKNGAPAPLSGVTMNFPTEGSAFGSMESLIKSGLDEDAMLQDKQEKGVQDIVNEIEATLPAWEAQLAEQGEQFAIESARQSLERTQMRDQRAKFAITDTVPVDDVHDVGGNLVVEIDSKASGLNNYPKGQWSKILRDQIRRELVGKTILTEDGDLITFMDLSAREPNYGKAIKRQFETARETGDYSKVDQKRLAVEHIASLVSTSTFGRWDANRDAGDLFKKDGINHRDALIKIDGQYYDVDIATALNADQNDVDNYGDKFYDIKISEAPSTKTRGVLSDRAVPHTIKFVENTSDRLSVAQKDRAVNNAGLTFTAQGKFGGSAMANAFANPGRIRSNSRNSIQSVEEVPAEKVTQEAPNVPRYAIAEEDPDTLAFLNDQLAKGDVIHAYKTFLEVKNPDGSVSLYPPMATKIAAEKKGGKRTMSAPMQLNEWVKSVGNPNSPNIFYDEKKKGWYYNLIKDNGDSVPAAYDPYQHSSNVVLNDQFEQAYQRPDLVTYEVVIPKSEMTSGFHYKAERNDGQVVEAALPVGEHPWKKGIVAGQLDNTDRTVYMTRWLMPYRRMENSEVAQMYKDILDKEQYHVAIPFNVVPPGLQEELEKIGVPIDYSGSGQYKYWRRNNPAKYPAGKPIAEGVNENTEPTKPIRPDKSKKKTVIPAKNQAENVSRFSLTKEALTNEQKNDTVQQTAQANFNRLKEAIGDDYRNRNSERGKPYSESEDIQRLKRIFESREVTRGEDREFLCDAIRRAGGVTERVIIPEDGYRVDAIDHGFYTTEMLLAERANKEHGFSTAFFVGYPRDNYGDFSGLGGFADTDNNVIYSKADVQNHKDSVIRANSFTKTEPLGTYYGAKMSNRVTSRHERFHLLRYNGDAAANALFEYVSDVKNRKTFDEINYWYQRALTQDGYDFYDYAEEMAADFYAGSLSINNKAAQKELARLTSEIDKGTQHGPLFSVQNENSLENDILNILSTSDPETLSAWVNDRMADHEDALENAKVKAPAIPSKGFVPRVTPEQRNALNRMLQQQIKQYGAQKPSEKSNGFVIPAKRAEGQNYRRFYQNVGSNEALPQDARDTTLRQLMTSTSSTYVPDSDAKLIKGAEEQVKDMGYEHSMVAFKHDAKNLKLGTKDMLKTIALGEQLIVEAAAQGDAANLIEVTAYVAELGTTIGKSLQAFRLLKQMGPIGQLSYVQKAVDRINKQNEERIKRGKATEIVANPELCKAVVNAKTAEERDAAMDALIKDLAKQTPVTLADRWNAWRYLAMLGNVRTHVRNVIGNAVFAPLRYMKDVMATGGELLATKAGWMEEADRTKALSVSRELRDFALKDADVMQKELQGNGKYNPAREILQARKVLPGFLDTLSRFNGDMLEKEDWWFLRPAYARALSQQLGHSGFTVEELLGNAEGDRAVEAQKFLNEARKNAIQEAQKATYRDFSAVAAWLNKGKQLQGAGRIAAIGLEGVLPFTKTPINILKRGIEYSPIGIAKGIGKILNGIRDGNLDVAEAIDTLCAGLTGTGIAALGWLLTRMGILRGKKGDDDEENFDKLRGAQDYSIQIGNQSFTIDWAAPTALPLFTGSAIADLMEDDHELSWGDAWNAIMMIAEPMTSLSMLDGLNKLLDSTSYASGSEKLATIATQAGTSYLGQAFPTILGQVARTIDGTRRSTYVDKNSQAPAGWQRFVQSSVQSKIPGWESSKVPYIDAWGRQSEAGSKVLNGVENFFAPWYRSVKNVTDVDEELDRLYKSTKADILPSTPQKYFSVNGEKKNLTADEWVSYATDVGQTKYELLTQLFSDSRYLALTDDQKAKAIKDYVYKYATAAGKYHVDQNFNIHGSGVWIEEAEAARTSAERFERIWQQIEKGLKD